MKMSLPTIRITLIGAVLLSIAMSSINTAQAVTAITAQTARISGVRFIVPKDFILDQTAGSEFALMRHTKESLALFVAVPKDNKVNDKYLTDLSDRLASQSLSRQSAFNWKVLHLSKPKFSAFQTGAGATKGLKDATYVQTDFIVVKAQQRQIVVGSISVHDGAINAKELFDVEGREYSFIGWKGLFPLIASVTGEKQ